MHLAMRSASKLALFAFASVAAFANINIFVNNASFETAPVGGFPNACAVGCQWSTAAISGWDSTAPSGQHQWGTLGLLNPYFNSLSDGPTTAWSNGGTISQRVAPLAQAGVTYFLSVDLGKRKDGVLFLGKAKLYIDGNERALATGTTPAVGTWNTWSLAYTATGADNGKAIDIVLDAIGEQGDFDNVQLSATPEPSFYAVLTIGLSGLAFASHRRAVKNQNN